MEYQVCDSGTPSLCSTAMVAIDIVDEPLKVYEGVTPNGDGNNDYLRIEGIDYYTDNHVQIFDRYNNLVFDIHGYDNEEKVWRGQSNRGLGNGGLPEGTYFYLVDLGDNSHPRKGFVVLKRN
jgi:gliding motility-associated-like protein